jgi:phosphoribosyl 1,2-cyclic phosphodiesterase
MLGYCPLGSGSKGNCIYVGTPTTKILIDAGLSARQTRERLSQIGVQLEEIQAVVLTHEHVDHAAGLKMLAGRMGIPVVANGETARALQTQATFHMAFKLFTTGESFEIGDLEIHPFSIQHDAVDPVGFTMRFGGIRLGFCTDLGMATSLVAAQLAHCDYLYIESNHDEELVLGSKRPDIYKRRVLGRQGHLSNVDCAQLLSQLMHGGLRHIHLAHLSQECNRPQLALETIRQRLGSRCPPLAIAPQDAIGEPQRL